MTQPIPLPAEEILAFELGGQRCAIRAAGVQRVLRAVAVLPLPGAPPIVSGIVNVQGTIVPVLDIRQKLGLPPRPLRHTDRLVLISQSERLLAIPVDRVAGLERVAARDMEPSPGSLSSRHVSGVAKLAGGLALIYDLMTFLTPEESSALFGLLEER